MSLRALGYDHWVEAQARQALKPGQCPARVTAVDRDVFVVRNERGEIPAELAGRFRYTVQSALELPCVGDWVGVQWPAAGGPGVIHQVLPRRTFLRRKTPGKEVEYQAIAANIDMAFIIQGCQFDFNVARLERYLVMVNDGGIEPLIVLSKADLVTPEELEGLREQIRSAGICALVVAISSVTGAGLGEIHELVAPGKTYCLLGSSGVGKSTLINRLLGREELLTREVSETGEGMHTTSRRQLLSLEHGAMLVDTPGMRELGLIGIGEGVETTFSDIEDMSTRCRFPDCTHRQEPGCAVIAAVAEGTLANERYQSYLKLRKEAEFHTLSYRDKRRKDKAFGRFVKNALKRMKDE